MTTPADLARFEAFSKDVRGRLLLQTWALSGDLPASQKAVREALVIAWHHWRKVSLLDDAESYVRPVAWNRAVRRATARPFHRERGLDEQTRQTLAALHNLSQLRRRIVLLAHLTTLPLDQIAREVGVAQARAESELQAATNAVALACGVQAGQLLRLFEPMAEQLREIRWPKTSVLAQAGSTRRRVHTALGGAIAVSAFLGSGMVASEVGGTEPSLHAMPLRTPAKPTPAPRYPLSIVALLSEGIVTNELPGQWTTALTSDNTSGDGLVLPCQRQRFADNDARAAVMRTMSSTTGGFVGQAIEVSADAETAHTTWRSSQAWFAGCDEPQVQLMSTRSLIGVGDEATQVVLQDWDSPTSTIIASMARTGALTTVVVTKTRAAAPRPLADNTDLLGLVITKLCGLAEAGACVTQARPQDSQLIPVGKFPQLLGTWDLPPVAGVNQPWDATSPKPATANLAATRCDSAIFHGKGITGDLTRSFVIPTASSLPAEFGLTETIGTWASTKAARAFVTSIRDAIGACPRKDLGTMVNEISSVTNATSDLAVWRVRVDISDDSSVTFLMAIVRAGAQVAQLGFVPDDAHTISEADFIAMAHRAAERLPMGQS